MGFRVEKQRMGTQSAVPVGPKEKYNPLLFIIMQNCPYNKKEEKWLSYQGMPIISIEITEPIMLFFKIRISLVNLNIMKHWSFYVL